MPQFEDHTIVPSRRSQVRSSLAYVELFAELPPELLDRLAEEFRFADVETGTVVVSQGAEGDQFFVVDAGEFAVTVRAGQEEPAQIDVLTTGDVFGETALLTDAPRTATVTAMTPGRVWTLSAESFRGWLDEVPGLRERVTGLMRRREIAHALMSLQ